MPQVEEADIGYSHLHHADELARMAPVLRIWCSLSHQSQQGSDENIASPVAGG
jgi:hypothetical protein